MSSFASVTRTGEGSVADLSAGLANVLAAVSGTTTPPPGGGSVAAAAGALAAALAQMVAGLTTGRPRYAHVADEMQDAARRAAAFASELSTLVERDASAYATVTAAFKLPKAVGDASGTRYGTLQRAMIMATEAPLAIARAAASVAVLSADIAERGNTNAVADAAVAALLAEAACHAAALTVRVNVVSLADATVAARLGASAVAAAATASAAAARAVAAAERAC
jgi:glutamate formiminotransferase/formiminotetrahydrofolate cyclodeaminase